MPNNVSFLLCTFIVFDRNFRSSSSQNLIGKFSDTTGEEPANPGLSSEPNIKSEPFIFSKPADYMDTETADYRRFENRLLGDKVDFPPPSGLQFNPKYQRSSQDFQGD